MVTPAKVVIAFTACLLLLYGLYGVTHFYRDQGSIFFDPDRAFERKYSLVREHQAYEFRKEAFSDPSVTKQFWNASSNPTICAVVITVNRDYVDHHPLEVSISLSHYTVNND
jgi:hypothetical protein